MTQDEALAILKTGLNVFLTGEPGSGKTHTINRYMQWLRERGVEASMTASTGIAATHVDGMTIHSWSGIGIKKDVSDYDIEIIQSREKTYKRILAAKVLIIDEISMLDSATLSSVDRVLRSLRVAPEQPFGGLQVVFVGDFFQLPPVSREGSASFAFESEAWKEANPIICYLSEQHRQEDGDFLDMLTGIRRGAFTSEHRTRLMSRATVLKKNTLATRLYTHNHNVDRINDESLAGIEGKARTFEMTTRGSDRLVETLIAQCLSPQTLSLKEGASVMFTRNNFDLGYANGTLGFVTGFSSTGSPIVKTKGGKIINVEPTEWAIQDGTKILAKITQVPLRLAWAITVHKSQGMSLDAAVIDLSQAFEYGQGYVALSRVRTLDGLFLEGFNDRALMMHPKIIAQDRYFRAYTDAARKKFAELPLSEKAKLEKNFLQAVGGKEPSDVKKDSKKSGSLIALRTKYPNLGKPWSKEDDAILTQMFKDEATYQDIGKHFGRRPTAIQARLGHLGLIEDFWKDRKKG